jgi:hypothetical protein
MCLVGDTVCLLITMNKRNSIRSPRCVLSHVMCLVTWQGTYMLYIYTHTYIHILLYHRYTAHCLITCHVSCNVQCVYKIHIRCNVLITCNICLLTCHVSCNAPLVMTCVMCLVTCLSLSCNVQSIGGIVIYVYMCVCIYIACIHVQCIYKIHIRCNLQCIGGIWYEFPNRCFPFRFLLLFILLFLLL